MLLIAHTTLAGVTATPELELQPEESEMMAKAIVPVLDQFDFTPDPKVAAVLGLIAASAKVYGPRAYLIRARLQDERAKAREAAMRNITQPDAFAFAGAPN